MLPQTGMDIIVNRQMIGGHQLAIADRRLFRVAEIGRFLRLFERADRAFVDPVIDRIGVADGHAAAALVEKGDAQSDQFDQTFRQAAATLERSAELHQAQRLFGAMGKISDQPLLQVGSLIGFDGIADSGIPVLRRQFCDAAHPIPSNRPWRFGGE